MRKRLQAIQAAKCQLPVMAAPGSRQANIDMGITASCSSEKNLKFFKKTSDETMQVTGFVTLTGYNEAIKVRDPPDPPPPLNY